MRKLFLFIFVLFGVISYSQDMQQGITLDGSVNNSTIDTCDAHFMDSGGYELNC